MKKIISLSDLDGKNGFVINGIDSGDQSGYSVSSAGDVNGDKIDDIIIGAYLADANGNINAGESYVVYGSQDLTNGSLDLANLNGTNGFVINGIYGDDKSGYSVSSAGDVNNDGIGDLIIGTHYADPDGKVNAGESYVVYGSQDLTNGSLDLANLDGTNGFILKGIDSDDGSGFSVSSAGDVNNDGIDDLIIGAYLADANGNINTGESYVVYGGTSNLANGSINLADLDGTNGFVINGIDSDDKSGYSVSSAGDVNNDGFDDLIIGARTADPDDNSNAGESYVVYGGTLDLANGSLNLADLNDESGFVINGIDSGDNSGFSISSAGDVNDDGFDDLIIGAPNASRDGKDVAGESYVVYGFTTNDAPTVANQISDQTATQDTNFTFTFPANTFNDINGDQLIYTASFADDSPLPKWLSFDGVTGSFSGIPRNADVGKFDLKVTANDGEATVSDEFTITVNNTNDAPTVANQISDQTATEDSNFSFNVLNNFNDIDGDQLTYTATLIDNTSLPQWLSFDGVTGSFSGIPSNADVGKIDLKVTANDGEVTVSDEFTITVNNTNDAPTVANQISDQTAIENTSFSFTVPANTFNDIEGDQLTYTASFADDAPLPQWLSFDEATGSFSGIPRNANVGKFDLKVMANDGEATVSDEFTVTVNDLETTEVHRFFDSTKGVHFYTASEVEKDYVMGNLDNYSYEGVSYQAIPGESGDSAIGTSAVYRFFNSNTGGHLYTTSEVERDYIRENLDNWNFEDTAYYGYDELEEDRIALYRFYNSAVDTHFYTPSETERDYIQDNLSDYQFEGVAFYVEPGETDI